MTPRGRLAATSPTATSDGLATLPNDARRMTIAPADDDRADAVVRAAAPSQQPGDEVDHAERREQEQGPQRLVAAVDGEGDDDPGEDHPDRAEHDQRRVQGARAPDAPGGHRPACPRREGSDRPVRPASASGDLGPGGRRPDPTDRSPSRAQTEAAATGDRQVRAASGRPLSSIRAAGGLGTGNKPASGSGSAAEDGGQRAGMAVAEGDEVDLEEAVLAADTTKPSVSVSTVPMRATGSPRPPRPAPADSSSLPGTTETSDAARRLREQRDERVLVDVLQRHLRADAVAQHRLAQRLRQTALGQVVGRVEVAPRGPPRRGRRPAAARGRGRGTAAGRRGGRGRRAPTRTRPARRGSVRAGTPTSRRSGTRSRCASTTSSMTPRTPITGVGWIATSPVWL